MNTETMHALQHTIEKAQQYLLHKQHPNGYWMGELEADASVTAGYITVLYFMEMDIEPDVRGKVVTYVLEKQNSNGSWSAYHEGPGDVSVSIQCYLALRIAGYTSEEPFMQRAAAFIRSEGGIEAANTITQIWCAHFGVYTWKKIPTIPPELMFLPSWLPINIYEFASWSRATIVALILATTLKPVRPLPGGDMLDELSAPGEQRGEQGSGSGYRQEHRPSFARGRSRRLARMYHVLDRIFKVYAKLPWNPGRKAALEKTEQWVVDHQDRDGSWGGIMLPWVYSLFALKEWGYPLSHPVLRKGIEGIRDFIIEDEETLRLQPAVSPVWDTAWVVIALRVSGLPADHPALVKAARWLLDRQIDEYGDWVVKNPATRPGAWAFEFENAMYPDIDDTSVVPQALSMVELPPQEQVRKQEAIEKAVHWLEDMQSKDGGWAAFDRDSNRELLAHIPFADFMTPLDPTSSDVTAHVLELLAEFSPRSRALERGVRYLETVQEPDGSWYGRWGVNYTYGTGLTLPGLRAAGVPGERSCVQRALEWLLRFQQENGGWGESCATYEEPGLKGRGTTTPSQTGWSLLGLLSYYRQLDHSTLDYRMQSAIQRGIAYLQGRQEADGSWKDSLYTGTGFPRAFYLRYELYELYFPLMACAVYRNIEEEGVCRDRKNESNTVSVHETEGIEEEKQKIAEIPPRERVLLLPHCLRRTASCQGTYSKWGLECAGCREDCPVRILSEKARAMGYKGICVAPGGSLALAFVKEKKPQGIIAVACEKELEMGINEVSSLPGFKNHSPTIVIVPLLKDGCIDTEVDVDYALQVLSLNGS